ncbi:MAG: ferritin family protein [Deltaproteobacteria bacterium]|nr:ferritin family protein [Deltaproteobacteria bacterium]MBW2053266.1 ferritin family protein [Deltaproteobacteria bacterium]MBW2142427.1 ferritin family protein [Deltaproteobacteria bacterium]MBW2324175.1 ferritin family protein [Deltaproteobacteria bacterium]
MLYNFNADEVFQMAIMIEENGKIFYEKAQDKIDNPEVKEMFESLAQAEIQHRECFMALKKKLPPSAQEETVWDPDNEINQYLNMMAGMHVFRPDDDVEGQLGEVKDVEDALKLAIQFEKESIVFFLTIKENTEETQGRDMVDQIIKEELGHHKALSLELIKLKK